MHRLRKKRIHFATDAATTDLSVIFLSTMNFFLSVRYLSSPKLGFLAQNIHALRHKHGITPTFAKDTGFDHRQATRAHASIAAAKELSLKAQSSDIDGEEAGLAAVFVEGESVLARRRVRGGGKGDDWGQADLLDGWHPAVVLKVRNAGKKTALYSVR